MELKDYYKILHLPPSATLPEIKKSYRHLAQQFHPDKNTTDPYAAIYFAEIKEAYEVLTNPSKKNNYLQQRWYRQSLGKTNFSHQPIIPPTILKQLLELDKYVATLDTFRMNQYSLHRHLQDILSDDTIDQLKNFKEPGITHEITRTTLRIAKLLQKEQVEDVAARLIRIAGSQYPTIKQPTVQDPILKNPVKQNPIVQDSVADDANEQYPILQDPISKNPVKQNPIIQDSMAEDANIQDPILQDPIPKNSVIQPPIIGDSIAQDAIVQDTVLQDPISKNPVKQNPIIQDSVAEDANSQDPIVTDPLLQDPTAQDAFTKNPIKDDSIQDSFPQNPIIQEINSFLRGYNRKNRWEKYKGAIIILITALISLLIYFVSR